MDQKRKFTKATQYHTAIKNGGIKVVDEEGNIIDTVTRYRKIISSFENN
jgi:hypothetical protein